MLTGVQQRPEVRQALLLIEDARIREVLAENAELPLLNVSAQVAYVGLDDDATGAYEGAGDLDFIDYVLGLVFEQPWGHRAASAEALKARLGRSSALLAYQQVVQGVILDVKTALRDVVTNYELIQARRSTRIAAAENLRALLVEKEAKRGLTPEFLNLEFQRQESLAGARQQEVLAMANYEKSLAALYRAMGAGLTMKGIEVVEPADPEELVLDGPPASP
jgi:outer membrane protein TolC